MIKTEFGVDLKKKIISGVNKINKSVSSTLGPGGRNVIIRGEDGLIKVTKDGVSVAKSFSKLEDPVEDIGAQMIKKVSEKSADKAGDGTTTSTLLASVIVEAGIQSITQGSNPVEIKKGIDKAVHKIIEGLSELSRKISDSDQVLQVAKISANNDEKIGNMVHDALDKVGRDGIVVIEESKGYEDSIDTVEGMMFERGYKSPYFVTNQNTMEAVLENPYIFLYDGRISSISQVVPVLQAAAADNKPLLIIAEDIDSEALAILVVNKANNTIKVCAVKAPDFGDRRTAMLEDIAVITGGTVLSANKGHKLDKMKMAEFKPLFGETRMVTVTSKDTTLIDGKGEVENVEKRLLEIKNQIEIAKSNFEKEILQERLGRMTGGVSIIYVGGKSEIEMKERKDRVDDALHATKAAIEQGVVPGGGLALINCIKNLDSVDCENNDQKIGVDIIRKAIYSPFRTILFNSGIEDYYAVLSKINENKKESSDPDWEGYNVKSSEFVNMFSSGILDPTKVTKSAIENAASVAGTILTTESVVYYVGDEKKEEVDYSQFM